MTNLIIFGGGSFLTEVLEYIEDFQKANKNKINILGIIDELDNKKFFIKNKKKIPIYKSFKKKLFPQKDIYALIALGSPNLREKCRTEVEKNKLQLFKLIHPLAKVSKNSIIEKGCIICPFSFVAPDTKIQENSLISIYASVGHHSKVGKSSVISPYSTLLGKASCGSLTFVGSHCAIIGKNAVLGNNSKLVSGSILYKKIRKNSLVQGNPAEIKLKL